MGLFNRKDKKVQTSNEVARENKAETQIKHYSIGTIDTENGPRTMIEYINPDQAENFRNGYDTTRLIINGQEIIAGVPVYTAEVAHYNYDDAVQIVAGMDGKMHEQGSRTNTTSVRLEIDGQQLYHNIEYTEYLMKDLLDKKRVQNYMERGMENNPESLPCGNYIGGVVYKQNEGRYRKNFQPRIGEAVHNSPEFVEKRTRLAKIRDAEKARDIAEAEQAIAEYQAKIAQLKGESGEGHEL